MKVKMYFYLIAASIGAMLLVGCDDNDGDNPKMNIQTAPEAISRAFTNQYPTVANAEWGKKFSYYVVEFDDIESMSEVEVWFEADGTWVMTETDYERPSMALLPEAVQQAFNNSEYSTWLIDDIVYYEYPDAVKNMYEVGVEKRKNPDMNMYFGFDGRLIKVVQDNNIEITPNTVI